MAVLIDFLLGLVIFLFGMNRMESGISLASDRQLKRWLYQSTRTPLSSALSGIGITALLQSSSMVSLIVLAFASAGMIPLYNAIGVLLGANLGTTFTGWVVTLIGFKLDFEQLALPIIGIGCLLQLLPKTRQRINATGIALFGLGLLVFGLNLMKSSVADLPSTLDMGSLQGHSSFVYLLAGILLTAVIQSSSASMMIALSLLNAEMITLVDGAALIIGADLGTTSTTILGSMTGSIIKKQLAMAHFIFNVVIDVLAFFLLLPALPLLLATVQLEDPLYSLVAFHSLFNLLGLIVFLPMLKRYTRWVSRLLKATTEPTTQLSTIPSKVPEAALAAMLAALKQLLIDVLALNIRNLHISLDKFTLSEDIEQRLEKNNDSAATFEQQYESIKQLEGEVVELAIKLQQQPLAEDLAQQLSRILDITRAQVYSAKTLKDIRQNLVDLRHHDHPTVTELNLQHQHYHQTLYNQLTRLVFEDHDHHYLEEQSAQLHEENNRHHHRADHQVYRCAREHNISGEQASTLFNVNREIHHATQSLLDALDIWLKIKALPAEKH